MTASTMNKSKFILILALFCIVYWILDSIWSYWSFEINVNAPIFSRTPVSTGTPYC